MAAQDPFFLKLNRSNGLPSDAVYNVFQDHRGYIWLATDEGLCRYDGFECTPYHSPVQTSMAGSCIQEDKYGRIWYETFDGYLYYTDSGALKTIRQTTPDNYVPFGITARHLFILQKKGIDVFDLASLRLLRTLPLSTNMLESAARVYNAFCIVSGDRIYRVADDLTITSIPCPISNPADVRLVGSYGSGISLSSRSNESKRLYLYDSNLVLLNTLPLTQPRLINASAYVGNKFWINTADGSYVYSPDTARLADAEVLFRGKSVSGMLKDRQGNYWFATTNEGIYIVPTLHNKIHNIPGYTASRLVAASTGYLVGTKSGELLQASQGCSKFAQVSTSGNNAGVYYLYADSANIVYSSLGFSIAPANDIGHQQRHNYALKSIATVDKKYYAVAGSGSCALMLNPRADPHAHSPWDGIFAANRQATLAQMAYLQTNIRAKSVACDSLTNRIICASNKGLFSIGIDTITELTLNAHHLYATTIVAANGEIYALGSKGNLYKIARDGAIQMLDTTLGLHSDVRLLKHFGDYLFFTAQSSLLHYHLPTGRLQAVDINIEPHDINDILLHNDTLWIATDKGIIEINHDTIPDNKVTPLFYINEILVNNSRRLASALSSLRYTDNNIAINYSILDFGSPMSDKLYYRLGSDKWEPAPAASRTLAFRALSPGHYVLTFRLGDKILPTSVCFTIHAPFWQQWWFYAICFGAVSLSVLGLYWWQLRSKFKKLEIQNQKIQLEQDLGRSMLTSIRAQMNPHFFYNALNTIQAYIFTNDRTKASSYLAKFSKLTRIILEMSDTETVSLKEEAEALKLHLDLEQMRFSSGFEYSITMQDIASAEIIEIPSMIIQPYVENAVKHGLLHKEGDKLVSVIFQRVENRLLVTIDDNGIGRKKADELNRIKAERFRSFSTQANSKRMDLLNKGKTEKLFVVIEDKFTAGGQPAGTRVILSIPI